MLSDNLHIALVLLLPLAGGLLTYWLQPKRTDLLALVGMTPGLILSALLVFKDTILIRWTWLPSITLGWHIDQLAAILILLVYIISYLVHLFSAHYLKGDPGLPRFYAKLGFFTFSMLGLLAADHLLLLFVFWELVGFSSFLLIGFWFTDADKAKSAREAFMVNRVADAGLVIGVIFLAFILGQPMLSELEKTESSWMLQLAGFGLLAGALGKSAQFPFFGWLPKAMAGPTPVSALIHAATMVAAGVYLLVRVQVVLTEEVLLAAAILGGLTAFMAAFAALTQHDIKKVPAYSTISQLGYMVMGVGIGAYQASAFHLWTHAFFKAGLFLAAGSVIHYFHHLHHHHHDFDAQDMRNMGGVKKVLPVTYWVYVVCGLALSGLPFFSGFLSKEGILSGALIWAVDLGGIGYFVAFLGFASALLTPFYIARQVLLVFHGSPRTAIKPIENAEPLAQVKIPLVILGICSLWFVHAMNPFDGHGWYLQNRIFGDSTQLPDSAHLLMIITLVISVVLTIIGLGYAYLRFKPGSKNTAAYYTQTNPTSIAGRLSFAGWYLQEIYSQIGSVYVKIGGFLYRIDQKVIDKAIDGFGVATVVFSKALAVFDREIIDGVVNLAAWVSKLFGSLMTKIQAARVQNQLLWLVLLLLILLLWAQI